MSSPNTYVLKYRSRACSIPHRQYARFSGTNIDREQVTYTMIRPGGPDYWRSYSEPAPRAARRIRLAIRLTQGKCHAIISGKRYVERCL